MKKLGIRALAQETGFSIATVSRVLNGSKSVSAETRSRVEEAIARLNYIPNPAARALSTRRTRMIGAVIPTIEHSIFSRFIGQLESSLAAAGYSLVIASSAVTPEQETLRAIELLNIGVEALVVSGLRHDSRFLAIAEANGTPVVCTSIYDATSNLPTIGYDNFRLGADALHFLKSHGHRRIAVLHGPVENNDRTVLRLDGIRSAADGSVDVTYYEKELSVHGGVAAAHVALTAGDRPSALLCLSDVLALGALFQAPRLGLSIPSDVSVMGFDNLEWADASSPALTTIDLPVVTMGEKTAEAVIAHLTGAHAIQHVRLDGQIIERDTVRLIDGA